MAGFAMMLGSAILPSILPGLLNPGGGGNSQPPAPTAQEPQMAQGQTLSGLMTMKTATVSPNQQAQSDAFAQQAMALQAQTAQQLATAQAQLDEQKAQIEAIKGQSSISPAIIAMGVGTVLLGVFLLR